MPPILPAGPGLLLRALFKRGGASGAPLHSEYIAPNLEPARLAGYNELFGFAPDTLPITYYYPLVQRAHLATMLAPAFPFRLLGMIHAENLLREMRRPDLHMPLSIATEVELEPPTAHGARYCTLRSQAMQGGSMVFSCTSRYLARRDSSKHQGAGPAVEAENLPSFAAWELDRRAGRRYAALSGDWNPIHLWPWSARLFGLPGPIIHGMHTVAAVCAQLERTAGGRVTMLSARFKSPVALGSRLEAFADSASYRVRCAGKIAVEGGFASGPA